MQRRHLSAVLAAVAGLAFAGILAGSARAATPRTSSGPTTGRPATDGHPDEHGPATGRPGTDGHPDEQGLAAGRRTTDGHPDEHGPATGRRATDGIPDEQGLAAGRRTTDGYPDEHGMFWAGGTVTAVDPAAGTVTIARLGTSEHGATETVRVAADASITVDRAGGTLAGLPIGARALITGTVGENTRTAVRIDAATSWPLRLGGTVVSVAGSRLTLADADKTTITVTVVGYSSVLVDGRTSSLAAVPAGARVWVDGTATATSRTVTKVTARTGSAQPTSGQSPRTAGSGRKAASWN